MPGVDFWIRPLEPLFFGESRSFSAGEAHHGASTFPPTPTTFQGILRTHLLAYGDRRYELWDHTPAARNEREEMVGGSDALPQGWQLSPARPAVRVDNGPGAPYLRAWFPAPRFLVTDNAKNFIPSRAQIMTTDGWTFADDTPELDGRSSVLPVGFPPSGKRLRPLSGWIDDTNLRWALTGAGAWRTEGFSKDLPPFVQRERQVGVTIDDQFGTARDQLLYSMQRLRFEESSGLWGRLETGLLDPRLRIAALQKGVGHAGRRARTIEFSEPPEKSPDWQAIDEGRDLFKETVADRALFWLYLSSPVWIAAGRENWRPEIRLQTGGPVRITVRGAFIGPPETIGGRRIADSSARGNRLFAPAGSAWLIELSGGSPEERLAALRRLNGTSLVGPAEDGPFGFGCSFIGVGPQSAAL